MTRYRFYILAVFAAFIAVVVLACHILRKRGVPISRPQEWLFMVGALLIIDTALVSQLSNFNLGVILPAILGTPMVLLAFLLPRMRTGAGAVIKWTLAGGYAVAIVLFLVCGALMLSACAARQKAKPADALIVLGAAVHGDRVTWVLSNRLDAAVFYMEAHPDCIAIVSGGQGPGESVTEGSAMKKYMEEHGVAPERVFAEEKAKNTSENFINSMELVRAQCGEDARVAFVTTDFHVYRAGRVARALGIDAYGVPAEDVWYIRLNNFLRESVGIVVYALRGRL